MEFTSRFKEQATRPAPLFEHDDDDERCYGVRGSEDEQLARVIPLEMRYKF
jgi:hypothetical protein